MPQMMKEFPYAGPGIARDAFVKGASGSCAQKQKTLPENKNIPAAAIDAFCSCFGGSLADVLTRDEIASLGRHEAPGPGFTEKARTVSEKCSRLANDR
jgi:hypothetical protein